MLIVFPRGEEDRDTPNKSWGDPGSFDSEDECLAVSKGTFVLKHEWVEQPVSLLGREIRTDRRRQTDAQADRRTDRQTGRQTDTYRQR